MDDDRLEDDHPFEDDDPFEDWERYPSTEAQEQAEYQKLAWFSAPFGSAGVTLLLMAAAVDLLRRLGRQIVRIAYRLKLV